MKGTNFRKDRCIDAFYCRRIFGPLCHRGMMHHHKALCASTGEVTPNLDSFPPPGCTRLKVELKKPLGELFIFHYFLIASLVIPIRLYICFYCFFFIKVFISEYHMIL